MKGSVRRSQLISTYGVGSMVSVGDESVMIAGLDFWPPAKSGGDLVLEPRLQVSGKKLRLPPGGMNSDLDQFQTKDKVPVTRFPKWYSCSGCRRLGKFGHLSVENKNQCVHCGCPLIPSRFVALCEMGHIEDFPYWHWVHTRDSSDSEVRGSKHEMYLISEGKSGSLSGIKVECRSCGVSKTLDGVFGKSALLRVKGCSGAEPWLGIETEDCNQPLRASQRGASNVWFPMVRSALSIPPWSDGLQNFVGMHWATLQMSLDPDTFRTVVEELVNATDVSFPVEEVLAAVKDRQALAGEEKSDEQIRREEFQALCVGRDAGPQAHFVAEVSEPPGEISKEFELVTVVSRLREVRVLTGFTRMHPGQAERVRALSKSADWLPAIPIHGEGVFLKLRASLLSAWEQRADVLERVAVLQERWAKSFFYDGKPVTPRFLLAHVLAHALIDQWSLAGGYPAASLRERVYSEGDSTGILIYTAASDSAGSLGGVIAQAHPDRLRASVVDSIRRYEWCSSDPVCSETSSQGAEGLNMAACHSCALLPETSCEHRNSLLDRALLVGLPGNRGLGYFSRIISS
jgi:hypothetical protein